MLGLSILYCGFFFSSGDWLNYSRGNTNTLLSCEVEALIDKIELLMSGNIQDITEISCIEPDFVFILHPEKNKDCENIYMELNVNFWNEGMMTENHLTVIFGKYEILILLTYLKYVTGKLKIADSEIIDLIKKDFLID